MTEVPTPRRLGRPRWLDVRVIGGVLLLIASVVIGAKVIGASSRTSPVWVAADDLAEGTVLRTGDLVRAEVNLGDRGDAYLSAASSPLGRILNRPVDAGELVPAAAVGTVRDGRIVSVSVAPQRMAPGVQHGAVIDLYLTTGDSTLSGGDATTRLLQAGITVQSVTPPAAGGLSGATSSHYRVALLLPPDEADALVRALPGGRPLVVLRTAASDRHRDGPDIPTDEAGAPGRASAGVGPAASTASSAPAPAPSDHGG